MIKHDCLQRRVFDKERLLPLMLKAVLLPRNSVTIATNCQAIISCRTDCSSVLVTVPADGAVGYDHLLFPELKWRDNVECQYYISSTIVLTESDELGIFFGFVVY